MDAVKQRISRDQGSACQFTDEVLSVRSRDPRPLPVADGDQAGLLQ